MAFTDEDLKRVTDSYETLREMRARGVSEAETMSLTLPEWDSLLARLDAAEKVCEAASEKIGLHNKHCNARHKCALPRVGEALVAWQKAAGKSQ